MKGNPSELIRRWESPGIRGWGPTHRSQFGGNHVGILGQYRLQSLCFEKWDNNEKSWETSESFLFAWFPGACRPSVSAPRIFSYLHSIHHLLFSCGLIMTSSYMLELLRSFSHWARKLGMNRSQSCRQLLSSSNLSDTLGHTGWLYCSCL